MTNNSHRSPVSLSRSSLYRVEAMVLRHRDLGEADRLLTLFTKEHGKLRVSARGVRKVKSRTGGHVEPLTYASLLLVRGRSLDVVSQAQAVETFPRVRADLVTTLYGLHMGELIDLFTEDYEAQPSLFALLLDSLRMLDAGSVPAPLLARAFEMGLLELSGYRPVLDRCVSCNRALPGTEAGVAFAAHLGGAVCARCQGEQRQWMRAAPPRTLASLRLLQREGLRAAGDSALAGDPETASDLEALLRWYLRYVLERPLETMAFLDNLRAGRTP